MTSKIEWTEDTWNPVVGCTWASPGCDNCYAAKMTRRLEAMGNTDYAGLTSAKHFNGTVRTLPDKLDKPLKRRKPTTYFVNSMSDLFHEGVPWSFIAQVFAVMRACPHHTFQILTKRPERMAALTTDPEFIAEVEGAGQALAAVKGWCHAHEDAPWPSSNIWLGTSVENRDALERITSLAQCPAAVRFISFEPLLEDLGQIRGYLEQLADAKAWAILGNESHGTRAGRFSDGYESAARSIINQGRAGGVPMFHKQMPVGGKVSRDMTEWPEDLRVREMPRVYQECK